MAQDRYKYFRIEAREILDGLAKGLLALEKAADADLIARLLRLAHTLKGAARIVSHRELAELAHKMEDALAPLRQSPVPQRLDHALALVDQMTAHVAALQQPEPGPATQGKPAVAAAGTVAAAGMVAVIETPMPRSDPAAVDELLGGLAELHGLLGQIRGASDARAIEQMIDRCERELRSVRQDAERLRLLTVGTSFTALERTARDVAQAEGKRVAFVTSGGEVRIDAHVLATLHPALVQLVRNAVAHGLETPAERAAAGKPTEGQVSIAVALQGSRAAITCQDDGRGLDLEAVRRAAVRRGLADDRARELDRDQLIGLLLRGGITTTTEVTAFAGRGIGLDVVREAAQVLGGEVTVRTGAGGTAITVTVPTSVAAISALVLGADDRIAALPLAAIRRVARTTTQAIVKGPDGLTVAVDDITVPYAALSRLLGGRDDQTPGSIVIFEGGDRLAALGVDRVLGVEDVVVRSIPDSVPVDPVVWGVALDAEGLPRPILEPMALASAVGAIAPEPSAPVARPLPILIVDDSLTTRMLEQSILESAGFEVELASSGEEGLDKAARRAYGLFLVDVEMPGIDGFEFIAAVRAQPQLAPIPAILVTSRNAPEDRRRGVAVGAQGYVVKGDFDQTKLLEMIRRLVRT